MGNNVTLADMVEKVKKSVDFTNVGMIACHNGVVRGTSREGKPVSNLEIDVDMNLVEMVLKEMRSRKGIAAVEAHVFPGIRRVGQDVMLVVVAGDFRENVFKTLEETVNRLKTTVVHKKER